MTLAIARHGLVRFLLLIPAVSLVAALACGNCHAQSESLDVLQQQWRELEVKFADQKAAMESGEGDVKAQREQYRNLLDQANELISRMKTAAVNEISEDPENKSAIRTLMGLLLHDAANGDDGKVLTIGDTLIEKNIDPRYFEVAAKADRLSIDAKEIFEELLIRQREFKSDDLPRVKLTTTKGDIVIELYEDQAPNTVANFVSLVESDYYSDLIFHRVLEDFMAQTGGFKSDGSGGNGPGYSIACECTTPEARPHFSHCISMAHAGKDTGGSQFFLTFARPEFDLDGRHTCFGRIIAGAEILDKIERTHIVINDQEQPIPNVEKDRIVNAEVIRKRDHDYQPKKIGDESATEEKPKSVAPPRDPNLSKPDEPTAESDEEDTTTEDSTEADDEDSSRDEDTTGDDDAAGVDSEDEDKGDDDGGDDGI